MSSFKVRPPERGVRFASYEEVFSPDYKYTAYVEDYNLYLRDIEQDKVTALTTDGRQTLAQLGFLVVRIDNRGLLRRGKEFETSSYKKLGQTDVEDLVASVKYLSARPYVDTSRVGIFGGSYGGYMSILALLKAPEHFHVGVAGSPATDWRNYDTIYTERYMSTSQYNKDGYEAGNPMNFVDNLAGKLLIQHGAVDDNVHPTQVMQLVDALLKAGKRFEWFIYPGQAHGIRYRQAGLKRMDFFLKHLAPGTKEEWFAN